MRVARAGWIPVAALAFWLAFCSPAAAVSEAIATDTPAPQVALRADHMVLDAALRDTTVLVAVQSGRVEAFDWLDRRSAFVLQGRRLISGGNDARVLVWEVSAHLEGGSP